MNQLKDIVRNLQRDMDDMDEHCLYSFDDTAILTLIPCYGPKLWLSNGRSYNILIDTIPENEIHHAFELLSTGFVFHLSYMIYKHDLPNNISWCKFKNSGELDVYYLGG